MTSYHQCHRHDIINLIISDIIITSYHSVEHLEERDTAFQFLDGGHQLYDEVEEEESTEHH